MQMSSVPSARVLANHHPRTVRPAAKPGVRRDPTTLATALLAVAGAALIAASAAADSSLLGDSANACPKCKDGTCYQEVVTYRCKQVPDNKPVKKTVYECREVPYCEHKLPRLGHGDCCLECEACPKFKKVLVKKEVVVGETCGTQCVPERFVERIPVRCCRCGHLPPGAVPPPTAEPKPAAPNSITSLTLRVPRQPLTQTERLPEAPSSGTDASPHSAITRNAQSSLSARRLAATSPSTTAPRDDSPASPVATAPPPAASVADAPQELATAVLDSIAPATDAAFLNAPNAATSDTTTTASAIQESAVQESMVQESAVQESAVQESTVPESAIQKSAVQESATSPTRAAPTASAANSPPSAKSATTDWRHGRLPATASHQGQTVRRSIRDAALGTPTAPVEGQLIRLTPHDGR